MYCYWVPDRKRNERWKLVLESLKHCWNFNSLFAGDGGCPQFLPAQVHQSVYYKIQCRVNISIFRRETSRSHVLRVCCLTTNRKRKQEICLEQLPVPASQLNPQTGVLMSSQNSLSLWCIHTCVQFDIKDHQTSSVVKISACKRWPKKTQELQIISNGWCSLHFVFNVYYFKCGHILEWP